MVRQGTQCIHAPRMLNTANVRPKFESPERFFGGSARGFITRRTMASETLYHEFHGGPTRVLEELALLEMDTTGSRRPRTRRGTSECL